MRFMIIVKATKDSEAGVMPPEQILTRERELLLGRARALDTAPRRSGNNP